MRTLIAQIFFVLASPTTFASTLLIPDPQSMQCQLFKDPGYYQCNILYDSVLIYEGPTRSPAEAGADCLTCKNAKAEAQRQGASLALDRQLGWDDDDFLTVIARHAPLPRNPHPAPHDDPSRRPSTDPSVPLPPPTPAPWPPEPGTDPYGDPSTDPYGNPAEGPIALPPQG